MNMLSAVSRRIPPHRRIAALMVLEAVSLAVMSALHLSGVIRAPGQTSTDASAGVPEAVICVVLLSGAYVLARGGPEGRLAALYATGFAIAGFIYGLSLTVRSGPVADIAYHATVLPILIVTFVVIWRTRQSPQPGRAKPAW